MSHEVIKAITDAEESAREDMLKAQAAAKAMIAKAEKEGQTSVSEAISRAEEETKKRMLSADEKAAQNAAELQASTSNFSDDIRRRAETRLNQAASLIVERIVQN